MIQDLAKETLRCYCGGYLLCLCVCTAWVAYAEFQTDKCFKLKHVTSVPFYGVMTSVVIPLLLLALYGVISFMWTIVVFTLTGEL